MLNAFVLRSHGLVSHRKHYLEFKQKLASELIGTLSGKKKQSVVLLSCAVGYRETCHPGN